MSQHDYNIANQTGADFRADLNNALSAIATTNSGATEPTATFAHQLWVDTGSNVLKIRNGTNSAWITTGVSITASNTFTGNLTGNVTGDLTGDLTGTVLTAAQPNITSVGTLTGLTTTGDINLGDSDKAVFGAGSDLQISHTGSQSLIDEVGTGQLTLRSNGTDIRLVDASDNIMLIAKTSAEVELYHNSSAKLATSISGITITGTAIMDGLTVDTNTLVVDSTNNRVGIGTVSPARPLHISGTTITQLELEQTSASSEVRMLLDAGGTNGQIQFAGASHPSVPNTLSFVSEANTRFVNSGVTSMTIDNTSKVGIGIDSGIGAALHVRYSGAGSALTLESTDSGTSAAPDLVLYRNSSSPADDDQIGNIIFNGMDSGANVQSYARILVEADDVTSGSEDSTMHFSTIVDGTLDERITIKGSNVGINNETPTATLDVTGTIAASGQITGSLTGNASTATALATARTISLDGDVAGSASFDGTSDITITSTIQANSIALGTDTVGNYVATITGTANKVSVSGSGSESANITLSLPDDVQIADSLTVAGNLTVNGTLVSLDTTNLDIADNLFQLNAGLTGSPVNDSGMLINRGNQNNGIFMWDESVDKFTLGLTTADGTSTGNITLSSLGTLVANVEGNVTGQVSDISNFTTANLTEGSNLYYTDARSRAAISATGDISYNSSTGVISFTQSAFPVTSVNTLTGAVVLDTDDIGEGSTNVYYTDARVQAVSINNVVEDTTPQLGGDLASNGNDILFGDNDKAIFGAGSDLQIHHNGTNSFIDEVGTGRLYIRAENNLTFTNAATTKTYANFENAGAAKFYYNSVLSLLTTTAGAEVREGLTVGSSSNDLGTTAGNQLTPLTLRSDTSNTDRLLFTTERLADGTDWTTAAHRIQRKVDTTKMGYIQLGNFGSDLITFGENASEYMRLDGDGKLGISATSLNANLHIGSANATGNATNPALQIGGADTYRLGLYTSAERGVIDCPNGDDGLDFRVKTAGLAMRVLGGTGGVRVIGASALGTSTATANNVEIGVTSGTTNTGIKFDTASTAVSGDNRVYLIENKSGDRLRFMTAAGTEILSMLHEGRVGIGQTNPIRPIHLSTSSGGSIIHLTDDSTGHTATDGVDIQQEGTLLYILNREAGDIRFGTSATERMRLDSSGRSILGDTSPLNSGGAKASFVFSGGQGVFISTYSQATGEVMGFVHQRTSVVGTIAINSSSTTYNTSSDARLKDVTGKARGLDVINKLNPVSYNWKADGRKDEGLIAQECEDIVPNAVTKNSSDYYGMDYSKLVVHLVKGMQEQQEQIEELKEEIQKLKG